MDWRQVASNEKGPLQFCRSASLMQDKKRPAPVLLVSGSLTHSSGFRPYGVITFSTRVSRFASICHAKQQQPRAIWKRFIYMNQLWHDSIEISK
jgi:hypothetical protein